MPKLIRLYITQIIIGFAISAAFVVMLLAFDIANLRGLVTGSSSGYLAAFLLFMFNGIVFSGVQFGIAIMRMAEPENGGKGGRRTPITPAELLPIPVHKDRS
ncbi:hypothetical protein [Actibacterium lipolyticum]|uniref:Uncharacterized protein n=1 Tax=Actibacterium lipolyticum TaxID=1524263 RepID=A0A238JSF2_9RHOB|nr:hypothetical protein [Actibacterium lipolyticum]SMX33505.1 hypothetical protein COL8621_01037 [Actibacterium lipolyticum]